MLLLRLLAIRLLLLLHVRGAIVVRLARLLRRPRLVRDRVGGGLTVAIGRVGLVRLRAAVVLVGGELTGVVVRAARQAARLRARRHGGNGGRGHGGHLARGLHLLLLLLHLVVVDERVRVRVRVHLLVLDMIRLMLLVVRVVGVVLLVVVLLLLLLVRVLGARELVVGGQLIGGRVALVVELAHLAGRPARPAHEQRVLQLGLGAGRRLHLHLHQVLVRRHDLRDLVMRLVVVIILVGERLHPAVVCVGSTGCWSVVWVCGRARR